MLVILALLSAVVAAGCGGDDDTSSPLDQALSYLPADAPLAVAIATDLENGQYRAAASILDRFPLGAQLREQLKAELEGEEGIDFDADVRPLLGNDLVVAAPDVGSLAQDDESFIAALQVADAAKARELLERDGREVGESSGATIYEEGSGDVTALDGDVLVAADSREKLDQALARRDGADHLTEAQFEEGLADLPKDALVRVYGDMQAILGTSPESERAQAVPWVGALGTLGAAGTASGDGLAIDFNLSTDPADLTDEDLPIAGGPEPPPIVAQEDDVGFGVRDPSQVVDFAEQAGEAANTPEFRQFEAAKAKLGRRLGVNIDRDLVDQFEGDASLSLGVDGSFGFRSELQDPKGFQRTLDRLSRRVPDVAKGFGVDPVGIARPGGGKDFYAIATADRDRAVFGVVGGVFVLAQDPEQASELAVRPPEDVPGAQGSVTMRLDAESLAQRLARRFAGGSGELGADFFAGPLGDATGSVEAEVDRLRGHVELTIE